MESAKRARALHRGDGTEAAAVRPRWARTRRRFPAPGGPLPSGQAVACCRPERRARDGTARREAAAARRTASLRACPRTVKRQRTYPGRKPGSTSSRLNGLVPPKVSLARRSCTVPRAVRKIRPRRASSRRAGSGPAAPWPRRAAPPRRLPQSPRRNRRSAAGRTTVPGSSAHPRPRAAVPDRPRPRRQLHQCLQVSGPTLARQPSGFLNRGSELSAPGPAPAPNGPIGVLEVVLGHSV
jgi:hypothetical protein